MGVYGEVGGRPDRRLALAALGIHELDALAGALRAGQQGDAVAFEQLVRAFERPLHGFLARTRLGPPDLHDDIVQETWLRAWQGFARCRFASPDSAGRLWQCYIWLIRTAQRVALALETRPDALLGDVLETLGDPDADPVHLVLAHETAQHTRALLAQLSPAQRAVCVRYYLGDLSQRAIAQQLSCTPATVKRRLYQARLRLRALYQPCE